MNIYEQMRTSFVVELEKEMPGATPETLNRISSVLDRVMQRYEIKEKEMSLSVEIDQIPELVKAYIVVKKTEGLSAGTLENYSLILQTSSEG